jgi:hypothetical protein
MGASMHVTASLAKVVSHILPKVYNFYRDQVRVKLQNAKSLTQLSLMIWSLDVTKSNQLSRCTNISWWVDDSDTLQNMLIAHLECTLKMQNPREYPVLEDQQQKQYCDVMDLSHGSLSARVCVVSESLYNGPESFVLLPFFRSFNCFIWICK